MARTKGAGAGTAQSAHLRGGASIALAIGVMNVSTYAFTMVAARALGPRSYGAFAALMGSLLVLSVLQLGLQATGARRISASPGHVAEIERSILRVSHRAALGLGLLCLVLTPVIDVVLRLGSLRTAALVAVAAVPMTLMGGQAGVLQGERRWGALALVYLANGVPRLLIGTALVLWHPSELSAMLAVALSQFVPVVVGWWALRGAREAGNPPGMHTTQQVLRETVHNSHALLAFLALSNADVIVARNVLHAHEAGLYAAGLIVVKAVLFLPQFVVIVAFPSMSTQASRLKTLIISLGGVGVIGLVSALAAATLSSVALIFVGGTKYEDIEGLLWVFALVGTLLSMLQLLVYSVVATQSQRAVFLIWAALAVIVVGGPFVHTVHALLALVLATDATLFVVLLAVSLRGLRNLHPLGELVEPGRSSAR